MATEADFYLSAGDTSYPLAATLVDEDGNVDLTNATVGFEMRPQDADTLSIDSTSVIIDDATAGKVKYKWQPGDTDEPGFYYARFSVDYSGGTGNSFEADQHFPNEDFIVVKIDESL